MLSTAAACLIAATLATASPPSRPTATDPTDTESWAILILAVDTAPADAARIEDALRASIHDRAAARVQPRSATLALVAEARSAGLTCAEQEQGCLARLGAAAGVDRLVLFVLRPTPAGLDLEAVLLDVHADRVLARAHRVVIAPPPAHVLGDLVHELVSPESFVGAIELLSLPRAASVRLDGVVVAPRVGADGTGALAGVRPGRHVIDVRDGATRFTGEIDVAGGLVERVTVVMREPPPPASVPLPPSAWVAIAGGAASLLSGIGAGSLALVLEGPLQHELREVVIGTGLTLTVVSLVGGATAGVGGALWALDAAEGER